MKRSVLTLTGFVAALSLSASLAMAAEATATVGAAAGATTPAANVDANATASTTAALTINDIDIKKPLGDLQIDPSKTPDVAEASLDQAKRPELQNRCQVVIDFRDKFDPSVANWCQTYIDWKKKKM
jgi:hypothetical protein